MDTCKALRLAAVTQKALDMCLLFFTVYRKSLTASTPSLVLRARNHTPPLSTRRWGHGLNLLEASMEVRFKAEHLLEFLPLSI